MYGWAWWCLAVSPALGKLRWEDGEFEVSQGCIPGLHSKFQTGLVYVVRPGLSFFIYIYISNFLNFI